MYTASMSVQSTKCQFCTKMLSCLLVVKHSYGGTVQCFCPHYHTPLPLPLSYHHQLTDSFSFKHPHNQSYGAITTLFKTPFGNSSSPNTVVCAHGFNPFSFLIVFAKHDDHLFRGYAFTTSSMVSLWTSCSRMGGVTLSLAMRQ
jgi:hypothetical protein